MIDKKMSNNIKGCFFHKWKIDSDNGKTIYRKCLRCGRAEIIQRPGGYQPVDHYYLRGEPPVVTYFKINNMSVEGLLLLKLLVDAEVEKRGLTL